jgi:hypothetical protein
MVRRQGLKRGGFQAAVGQLDAAAVQPLTYPTGSEKQDVRTHGVPYLLAEDAPSWTLARRRALHNSSSSRGFFQHRLALFSLTHSR